MLGPLCLRSSSGENAQMRWPLNCMVLKLQVGNGMVERFSRKEMFYTNKTVTGGRRLGSDTSLGRNDVHPDLVHAYVVSEKIKQEIILPLRSCGFLKPVSERFGAFLQQIFLQLSKMHISRKCD